MAWEPEPCGALAECRGTTDSEEYDEDIKSYWQHFTRFRQCLWVCREKTSREVPWNCVQDKRKRIEKESYEAFEEMQGWSRKYDCHWKTF